MTTFKIRDTEEGYELSYGGTAKVVLTEKGGHGPLEKLYAVVERMSRMVRINPKANVALSKSDGIALILACEELHKVVSEDRRTNGLIND